MGKSMDGDDEIMIDILDVLIDRAGWRENRFSGGVRCVIIIIITNSKLSEFGELQCPAFLKGNNFHYGENFLKDL